MKRLFAFVWLCAFAAAPSSPLPISQQDANTITRLNAAVEHAFHDFVIAQANWDQARKAYDTGLQAIKAKDNAKSCREAMDTAADAEGSSIAKPLYVWVCDPVKPAPPAVPPAEAPAQTQAPAAP